MADVVLNLRDGRPIWAIPPWAVSEIRAAFPSDWSLHVAAGATDGSGDGTPALPPEVVAALRGARVYLGFGVPEAVLDAGGDTLEWVHSGAAGVGGSLHESMRASSVRFSNSAGIHGPPIAESVLAMLLHFTRGLDFAVAAQRRCVWDTDPFLAADTPGGELSTLTVGILGYGGIGMEVGTRLRALGTRVLGLRRSAPETAIDGAGVELLSGEDGMSRLLAESDALVISAPLTAVTRGVLSSERIRTLRKGAVVINVARGALVDEEGLLAALRDGHLRGAGLDVFAAEPLSPDHPFWEMPNVLITPHISAVTRGFWRRETDLIVENSRRYREREPLLNEVDRGRGY
ncbi:MAG: D-2-hydroxyacid dehydrogenase [Gemmatimonadota bacterium]